MTMADAKGKPKASAKKPAAKKRTTQNKAARKAASQKRPAQARHGDNLRARATACKA